MPSVTEFNLVADRLAERKALITVAAWMEDNTEVREILGVRTPDSSYEFNTDITTETDVLGITYTDVNKTEPTQTFDPHYIRGGSKFAFKLHDIMRRNALTELDQFTVYQIYTYLGNATDGYEADKHVNCTVEPTSLGGDTRINFPYTIHFSNDKKTGKVDKLTSDFVFTEDVAI